METVKCNKRVISPLLPMRLYIEGKLRTRKYNDRNNNERYTTEVVVDNFEMLSSKKEEGAPNVPFMNQQRYQQNPENWSGNDNMPY